MKIGIAQKKFKGEHKRIYVLKFGSSSELFRTVASVERIVEDLFTADEFENERRELMSLIQKMEVRSFTEHYGDNRFVCTFIYEEEMKDFVSTLFVAMMAYQVRVDEYQSEMEKYKRESERHFDFFENCMSVLKGKDELIESQSSMIGKLSILIDKLVSNLDEDVSVENTDEDLNSDENKSVSVTVSDETGDDIFNVMEENVLMNDEEKSLDECVMEYLENGEMFFVNVRAKKFHRPDCGLMRQANMSHFVKIRSLYSEMIEEGYSPCSTCLSVTSQSDT